MACHNADILDKHCIYVVQKQKERKNELDIGDMFSLEDTSGGGDSC